MKTLLLWILITFGITLIITTSELLNPIRGLLRKISGFIGRFFSCPLCIGFWAGVLTSFFWFSPTISLWSIQSWGYEHLITDGLLGAATSWCLYKFFTRM
tara:strand:+ start:259 stop:558 length:300 start_codon:yes stop_codon:yes gene_type:complete